MGEAPRLIRVLAPVFLLALVTSLAWPRLFGYLGKLRGVGFALGIELAAVGLVFWASAAYQLLSAHKNGRLATGGTYGLCRNPIFSWWIFFVFPMLALGLDSWLILVLSPFTFFLVRPSTRREEVELESHFGEPYVVYKNRVRAFLPLPHLRPVSTRRYARGVLALVLLGVFASAVLVLVVAPLAVGFGATSSERQGALPGDELIGLPWGGFTQAVAIAAPADEVWKWLVQVGYRRAGWYNIDSINRLAASDYFIDGKGSSRRIVPELQGLKPGDRIDIAPGFGFIVAQLEKPNLLVMGGDLDNPMNPNNAAWTFMLISTGPNSCRLISRFRMPVPSTLVAKLAGDLVGTVGGAIIQQPAMFAGIRERAEQAVR